MVFAPVAYGVTLNLTGRGEPPLTPARALATCVGPTCEPAGQTFGPLLASWVSSHFLKSFVVSVSWLGPTIFSVAAVCVLTALTTFSVSLVAFGLAFVPALLGDSETVSVDV